MNTVIVKSSRFNAHYPVDIPKNTVNAEAVLIRLDSEWDSLTVRIHWLNVASGVEKVVLLERDQPNTIPWEVLTELGELRMGLDGMDGGTVVKPTVWLTYGYVVEGVDPESGSAPKPPTPNWQQQMVEQAEAAANAAKAAKETADNLQAAAEAGEFDGDAGPEGPPGKSPEIRNGTWWIWSVEDQDYNDTGILASGGGGGGVSSYNDLSDRPRIGGVLLEGDKTAEELNLQPKGDYAEKTDIPSKLPAPYTLTFAGAVEAAYDGSQAVTVTIPTVAGPPGVSPTVATEEIDGGTRVTFTFQGGSETVDILDGITPNLNIGTVETLEPGSDATATITGTPESPRLNLGIPRGQNGKTPVKGIDYFTGEEIQAIASKAAALVPSGGGGESKEWKLFQTIDFSEEYADGVVSWEWTDLDFEEIVFIATGLTNINESTNSGLQIAVNGTTLMNLDTQKKTGATDTKYQRAGIVYNGLYWEPTKRQQSNNEQSYYSQFTNTLSPYSVKTDIGKCERLKLNPNAPSYNMYSGILKVYAR